MKTQYDAIDLLQRFIRIIPDAVVVYDITGRISFINKNFLKFLDLPGTASSYKRKNITTVLNEGKIHNKIIKSIANGGKNFSLQNVHVNDYFLKVSGKKIKEGMMVTLHNITTLIENQNTSTQLLLRAQELERNRIAKEVHDGLGPFISTLKLSVDLLTRTTNDDSSVQELKNISNQLSELSTEVRQVSHQLMPSSLIDFGLIAGVENMIDKLNRNPDIEISLINKLHIYPQVLTKEQDLNIFRIIQESVHNAIKHAECSSIIISLYTDEDSFQLEITDNGKGLSEVNTKDKKGIGLRNIRTRAKSLGGICEIKGASPSGSTVYVKIPINN